MSKTTAAPSEICDPSTTPQLVDDAIRIVGDFWTLRIIGAIAGGEMRFCELERAIPSINPATLTKRLKRMEENGLILRHTAAVDKQSVTYTLTEMGLDTLPILDSIKHFTEQHLAGSSLKATA